MSHTADLISWLEDQNRRVRELEARAETALQKNGDQLAYRELMAEKARCIASWPDAARPLLDACAASCPEAAAQARAGLVRFAQGAHNALRLDSVFYMSALLYPDEHRPGDPNNLERLTAEIRALQS